MTEPKPITAYMTGAQTNAVVWHCVTDTHGEGCGCVMGVIHFDPTRLTVSRDGEIVAIIRGDAEIRCPRCGKPQAWHWEREHPVMRNIRQSLDNINKLAGG